ncbi:hypothetical protein [Streptosporangium jomthongense]|uniref:Uncharacterized protein n=1 Tax=Streptosporangium jomthongense TaxID=1193683 RepID=A0ABV8FA26_9ACTN
MSGAGGVQEGGAPHDGGAAGPDGSREAAGPLHGRVGGSSRELFHGGAGSPGAADGCGGRPEAPFGSPCPGFSVQEMTAGTAGEPSGHGRAGGSPVPPGGETPGPYG